MNGSTSGVVSGSVDALAPFEDRLRAQGVEPQRVIDDASAFVLTSMLQDVVARTEEPEFQHLHKQLYLWSSAFLQSEGNDNTPQDARNPGAERSLSDYDVRHRLAINWLYELPFFRGQSGLAATLLAGQAGSTPSLGELSSARAITGRTRSA